jgi:hypothetical protein
MSVVILHAGYGVNNATRDATNEVGKAYLNGTRKFVAHDDWVGDPAPKKRKYLYIVWQQDGVTFSGVVEEKDSEGIVLP